MSTWNVSTDALKCVSGTGCFLNPRDLSWSQCFNQQGTMTNNWSCTNRTDLAWCQVSNATQLAYNLRDSEDLGPCRFINSSARRNGFSVFAIFFAVFVFSMTGVSAGVIGSISTITLPFEGKDTALKIGGTIIRDDEAYTITEIKVLSALPAAVQAEISANIDNNATIAKRQNGGCTYYSVGYKHTQVARTGLWPGPWNPVSGCTYTGLSDQGGTRTLNWGRTTSVSLGAGFDLSTVDKVIGIIKGNGGLNFGLNWEKSVSEGGSLACPVGPNSVGQVWYMQQMGYSDSQDQSCTQYFSCGSPVSTACGAYSAYRRADWPVKKNYDSSNLGCSTGSNNVRC